MEPNACAPSRRAVFLRGTMHDKLCRVLWFVKRVLWVCESNADSPYFWGALKTPRGSFKHKLNFNCFVQDVSETIWMWGWVVCHCYRLMRQMVTGLIAAMTPGSKGSWTEAEKECSVYLKLRLPFVADGPYVSPNKWRFSLYRSKTGATLGNSNHVNKHPCHWIRFYWFIGFEFT